MNKLIKIASTGDIPEEYANSPIGLLLEYHNLKRHRENYTQPELLLCTCMDSRVNIRMPDNFAFTIRTGGADMSGQEFKMSFAISSAGIEHLALIGHSDCGMVNLNSKKEKFVNGMVYYAGWQQEEADEYFKANSPRFEIHDETDFIMTQANRLRELFPKIAIAPMLYRVEDGWIYLIVE